MKNISTALHQPLTPGADHLPAAAKRLLAIVAAFALGACSTTPAIFPIESVNQSADKIIKEVWQLSGNTPAQAHKN